MSRSRSSFKQYLRKLGKSFKGELSERVSMKRHTTFKIGGIAEVMAWPEDAEDIEAAIATAEELGLPWRVIGAGSNLLAGDGGVKEVLINMTESFQEIGTRGGEETGEDEAGAEERSAVALGAGARLMTAVKQCQLEGLAGLEWAAGIPGSAGGAVIMNAGCMGSSISDAVDWVEWYLPGIGTERIGRDELVYEYRRLGRPPRAIVTACGLRLSKDDPRAIRERIVKGLKQRRHTQPLSHPSAGSVFKNPPGDYAGRLIEAAGLKGERIGDAQISDVHANFIVNRGRARSSQVKELIGLARERVAKAAGIELLLEIELIGEDIL